MCKHISLLYPTLSYASWTQFKLTEFPIFLPVVYSRPMQQGQAALKLAAALSNTWHGKCCSVPIDSDQLLAILVQAEANLSQTKEHDKYVRASVNTREGRDSGAAPGQLSRRWTSTAPESRYDVTASDTMRFVVSRLQLYAAGCRIWCAYLGRGCVVIFTHRNGMHAMF